MNKERFLEIMLEDGFDRDAAEGVWRLKPANAFDNMTDEEIEERLHLVNADYPHKRGSCVS